MCTCGMAMATQQATPATHSSHCACAGGRPKGRSVGTARPAAAAATGATAGGRWRMYSASTAMPMPHTSPSAT